MSAHWTQYSVRLGSSSSILRRVVGTARRLVSWGVRGFVWLFALLKLSRSLVIPAIAFPFGVLASDVDDPSKSLFEGPRLLRLSITIAETNLATLWMNPRSPVAASLSDGFRDSATVDVHLKGGERSGRPLNGKPSLALRFGRNGKSNSFHGLFRVKLNNCIQDPSGLNQVVASWVFNAAGVPCPRAVPAVIELNGRNLGLYELEEGADALFVKRNYGVDGADIYQGAYGVDIDGPVERTHGNTPIRFPFHDLYRVLANGKEDPGLPSLNSFIDVNCFYRFMAAEILAGHRDGYCMGINNYRFFIPAQDPLHLNNQPYGRIVFIPHGTDQTWGQPRLAALPMYLTRLPCFTLASAAARQKFRETFAESLTKALDVPRLQARIQRIQAKIHPVLDSMDPKFAQRQANAARALSEGLRLRREHLSEYFSLQPRRLAPMTQARATNTNSVPTFRIPPDVWIPHEQVGECHLYQTNGLAGRSDPIAVVAIQSTTYSSTASWRAKVLIPRGHYRFKGEACVLYSSQHAQAAHPEVLFQDYTGRVEAKSFPAKLNTWVEFTSEVNVTEPEETVELVIGMNGLRSGLLFDLASLVLETSPGP